MFHKPTSTTVGISVQPLNGGGGTLKILYLLRKHNSIGNEEPCMDVRSIRCVWSQQEVSRPGSKFSGWNYCLGLLLTKTLGVGTQREIGQKNSYFFRLRICRSNYCGLPLSL